MYHSPKQLYHSKLHALPLGESIDIALEPLAPRIHCTLIHVHAAGFTSESPPDLVPTPKTSPLAYCVINTSIPPFGGIHAQSLKTNFVICPKTSYRHKHRVIS